MLPLFVNNAPNKNEILDEQSIEIYIQATQIKIHIKKYVFDVILERMNLGKGGLFFIDGPRGTGKIILDHALLAMV